MEQTNILECIDFLVDSIIDQDFGTDHENELYTILQSRIKKSSYSNVYCVIQWLIVLHKTLNKLKKRQHLLIKFMKIIQNAQNPITNNKFEEYVRKRLFAPYKQYLLKLCWINIEQFQDKQSECHYFSLYNLLSYCIVQFGVAIRQFKSFFSWHYPELNQYISLLDSDLSSIYKQVSHAYEEKLISTLTFIQIDKLGAGLSIFSQSKKLLLSRTRATTKSPPEDNGNNLPEIITSIFEDSNITLVINKPKYNSELPPV